MHIILRRALRSSFVILTIASVPLGCAAGPETAKSDEDLSTMKSGTWVIDTPPTGAAFLSRITFSPGKRYEGDFQLKSGKIRSIAGTYLILPAQPNNPDSLVPSDKPSLALYGETGAADPSFEYDILPDGHLKFYASARHISFTMKKEPNYRPPATEAKFIACSGPDVDVRIALDQAQNRRGTLKLVRKASGGRNAPPSVSIVIAEDTSGGVPDAVYYEGVDDARDFYFNLKREALLRAEGNVDVNFRWAEDGQEFGFAADCAFTSH